MCRGPFLCYKEHYFVLRTLGLLSQLIGYSWPDLTSNTHGLQWWCVEGSRDKGHSLKTCRSQNRNQEARIHCWWLFLYDFWTLKLCSVLENSPTVGFFNFKMKIMYLKIYPPNLCLRLQFWSRTPRITKWKNSLIHVFQRKKIKGRKNSNRKGKACWGWADTKGSNSSFSWGNCLTKEKLRWWKNQMKGEEAENQSIPKLP